MTKRILILVAFLTLTISFLRGEERGLTLEDALSLALKNNPDILRVQKELDVSRGRRLQLEAIPNPEFVFSNEGLGKAGQNKEKEISLGIQQTIEFPGKRVLRGKIGKYGEEATLIELQRIKMIVSSCVEKAYFKAAYSQKVVTSLESVLDILKQYIDLATERYQTGQVSYLDVIRGKVEYLKVQNELLEAKREMKESTISLNLVMGVEDAEPYLFLTELSFTPFEKTLDDFKREVEKSPSLRILQTAKRQTETGLELSKKARFPDLKLGLFYPSLRRGAWGFEVGLTLPVWQKGLKGEILLREAENTMSQISMEAKKRRIERSLERAFSDLKVIEEQIKIFEDSLLAEIDDALRMGINNYQYGKTDSLSLLDVYRSYKETKQEFLKTIFLHRVAIAELQVAGEEEE